MKDKILDGLMFFVIGMFLLGILSGLVFFAITIKLGLLFIVFMFALAWAIERLTSHYES